MTLANLLRENLDLDEQDVWENERTPTPVRCFAVRLHSMGLSVREVEGVLDWLGVDHCYQAVWKWKEKLAEKQSDPPSENRHSFLRQWLAKFKGVSKHHLQKYLGFLSLKLSSPDDWFEKLLCYNVSR